MYRIDMHEENPSTTCNDPLRGVVSRVKSVYNLDTMTYIFKFAIDRVTQDH